MNPKLMVKKGGRCPDGDINNWFLEGKDLKDHVGKKLPKETANQLQIGQPKFGRYPENLLISRRRFTRAFNVCPNVVYSQRAVKLLIGCLQGVLEHRMHACIRGHVHKSCCQISSRRSLCT